MGERTKSNQAEKATQSSNKNRLRQFLLRLVFFILLMFFLLLSAFFWLISTEKGLQLTINWLNDTVSIVSIDNAQGRLIGPLLIEGLKVKTDALNYSQESITLDWSPSKLFWRHLAIRSIVLDGMDVSINNTEVKSKKNNEPLVMPDFIGLPLGLSVDVNNIAIHDAHIMSGASYRFDTIQLMASADKRQYQLDELSIKSDWLNLQVDMLVGTQYPFPLKSHAELMLSLDQFLEGDYADINTSLHIEGNADKLILKQSVQKPYNIEVNLTADTLFDDLYIDLQTHLNNTVLSKISPTLPAHTLVTDLTLKGSPDVFSISGGGEFIIDKRIELNYHLEANNNHQNIAIKQLQLTPKSNNDNTFVELTGNVDFSSNDLTVDLMTQWNEFVWPLSRAKPSSDVVFYSPQGELEIKGSANNVQLVLDSIIGEQGVIKGNIQGKNLLQNKRSVDAELTWNNIQYPIILSQGAYPTYKSEAGSLSLNGNQDNYAVSLNSDIRTSALTKSTVTPEFINTTINLLGQGNRTSFNLDALSIKPDDVNDANNQLLATGKAQFLEDFSSVSAQLAVEGNGVNPALLDEQWPGDLDVAIALDMYKNNEGLRATINEFHVAGHLRDYPVKAEAEATLDDQTLNVESLSLMSGDSRLQLSAYFSEDLLNAQWTFISDDLADLYPNATGSLAANGTVSGNVKQPVTNATLEASNIVFDTLQIKDINAEVDIDLSSSTSKSAVAITANSITANDFMVNNLTAQLNGSLEEHQFQLTTDTEQGQLEQRLSGQFLSDSHDFEWRFLLEDLQLAPAEFKPWQLQNAVAGLINKKRASIDPVCLQSDNNTVCINADADLINNHTLADIDIRQLEYRYFSPLFNDSVVINQAGVAGKANLSLTNNMLNTLQVALTTQMGTVQVPIKAAASHRDDTLSPQDQWVNFLLSQGNIDISFTHNNLGLNIDLPIDWSLSNDNNPIENWQGTAAQDQGLSLVLNTRSDKNKPIEQQTIEGELRLNAYDLDPVITLFPQLLAVPSEQRKALRANASITGTFNEPNIIGSIGLDNLALTVIDAGITLNDIQADISANEIGLIQYKTQVSSLPATDSHTQLNSTLPLGQLTIEGIAKLQGETMLTMTIEGNQFQAVNTPQARVIASPSLNITASKERINVNGEVLIPRALIAPNTIESSAVAVSSDQVIVSDEIESNTALPDIYADIRIELGDNVAIESFGFKGDIAGAVVATARPNSPTTGLGELEIFNGEYRAYGQGLVIDRGRIIFAGGNIEQPGVDIKAKRNPAENITVGVIAQGDIREPDFSLFSEPVMTQTEQLSWLILGKPLSDSTAGEGNALNQLALSIGLASGDDFLQKFNGKLGIDSIAIETGSGEAGAYSDNEQAAVTLGKYLTPKLYLSYGIGLFDALNTVKVEYLINPSLKLATESSSAASGADIIYNIGVK